MSPLPRLDATPPVTKMCFAKLPYPPGTTADGAANDARTTAGDRTMRPPEPRAPVGIAVVSTAEPATARTGPGLRHRWRSDAVILGAVALVLRLPALFATRSLVFDDGVFASSALAMRRGELPFREVFSSQGPVFLPLVWVADLLGFRTLDAPRLLTVASGVLLTIAVYSCARRVTSRGHALLAAGLVTTSGSVLWVTGPVNADGPSMALSVLAIALAFARARPCGAAPVGRGVGRPRRWRRRGDEGVVGSGSRDRRCGVVAGAAPRSGCRARGGRGARRVRRDRAAVGTASRLGTVVQLPQRGAQLELAPRRSMEGDHHTLGSRPGGARRARPRARHLSRRPIQWGSTGTA